MSVWEDRVDVGIVPFSMQYEGRGLLPVQDVRCVQVRQAVNTALGSCSHNEMPVTCKQLYIVLLLLPCQAVHRRMVDFLWLSTQECTVALHVLMP